MGNPDPDKINTSFVERQNLTMRIRVHKTLGATPAMASGLINRVMKMTDVVALTDARQMPAVRGPYKKQNAEISN